MNHSETVEKKHVSMYRQDWLVVDDVSRRYRLGNRSAALRYIVNEYQRCQEQAAPSPNPKQQENKS